MLLVCVFILITVTTSGTGEVKSRAAVAPQDVCSSPSHISGMAHSSIIGCSDRSECGLFPQKHRALEGGALGTELSCAGYSKAFNSDISEGCHLGS